MRQLHNAHNQLRETIIRYRFHPRYGQTVIVTSRNRRGNDVAVTIRQPAGAAADLDDGGFGGGDGGDGDSTSAAGASA